MIYIVALGVGFKCPRKIHLKTQCPPPKKKPLASSLNEFENFLFYSGLNLYVLGNLEQLHKSTL